MTDRTEKSGDREKATEPTEYPEVPAPTPARPWRLVQLPDPPGGLAIIPWAPADSAGPAQPVVISPAAMLKSQEIALPPSQENSPAVLLFAVRLQSTVPEPPPPVAPPGYRLERDPNYRPEVDPQRRARR